MDRLGETRRSNSRSSPSALTSPNVLCERPSPRSGLEGLPDLARAGEGGFVFVPSRARPGAQLARHSLGEVGPAVGVLDLLRRRRVGGVGGPLLGGDERAVLEEPAVARRLFGVVAVGGELVAADLGADVDELAAGEAALEVVAGKLQQVAVAGDLQAVAEPVVDDVGHERGAHGT